MLNFRGVFHILPNQITWLPTFPEIVMRGCFFGWKHRFADLPGPRVLEPQNWIKKWMLKMA